MVINAVYKTSQSQWMVSLKHKLRFMQGILLNCSVSITVRLLNLLHL